VQQLPEQIPNGMRLRCQVVQDTPRRKAHFEQIPIGRKRDRHYARGGREQRLRPRPWRESSLRQGQAGPAQPQREGRNQRRLFARGRKQQCSERCRDPGESAALVPIARAHPTVKRSQREQCHEHIGAAVDIRDRLGLHRVHRERDRCRDRSQLGCGGVVRQDLVAQASQQRKQQDAIETMQRDIGRAKACSPCARLMVERVAQFEQNPDAGHRVPPGPQGLHARICDDDLPVVELKTAVHAVGKCEANDKKQEPERRQAVLDEAHRGGIAPCATLRLTCSRPPAVHQRSFVSNNTSTPDGQHFPPTR
jgi:hypothetical protein